MGSTAGIELAIAKMLTLDGAQMAVHRWNREKPRQELSVIRVRAPVRPVANRREAFSYGQGYFGQVGSIWPATGKRILPPTVENSAR